MNGAVSGKPLVVLGRYPELVRICIMVIRVEKSEDIPNIRRVHELAFGQGEEGQLVDLLRERGKIHFSVVAVDEDDNIMGHVLFTCVQIEGVEDGSCLALGPMAVLPERQNQGVGTLLIQFALARCRDAGTDAVFVLGHPHYYPRFGFVPASQYGLKCKYEAPDPAFMVLELRKVFLVKSEVRQVHYQPEFDQV